jgi:hypothetical protein
MTEPVANATRMADAGLEETPEETRRFRVGRIGFVLARAGLPEYKRNFFATSPFADPVLQAGFAVFSRAQDADCVYTEWIDHWFGRGDGWRAGTARIIQALEAEGYAGEVLTQPHLNGFVRVTRPDPVRPHPAG